MTYSDETIQLALMNASAQVPFPTAEQRTALKVPEDVSLDVLWEELVAKRARDLLHQTSPASRLFKSVAIMGAAEEKDNQSAKVIWTTIESIHYDPTSNSQRVKVLFRGRPTKKAADGREHAFTERLDSRYEVNGRMVARAARELVGHRVKAYIEMQEMTNGSGQKVRVLRHLVDLGIATEKDFEPRS